MSRSRRTPPLFEVLAETARRDGPGATPIGKRPEQQRPAPPIPGRPVVVAATPSAGTADRPPLDAAPIGPKPLTVTGPVLLIAAAVVLAVIITVWSLGFKMGRDRGEQDMSPYVNAAGAPAEGGAAQPAIIDPLADTSPSPVSVKPTSEKPRPPRTAPGPAQAAAPKATPNPAPTSGALEDPRKEGHNYLEICTLVWKDAEAAVAYLGKNGVRAAARPSKAVDPATARRDNLPHVVYVLDGVPSDQFKATAAQRSELVAKIQQIGRKWQREERGPSDFSQPFWRRFGASDRGS